MRNPLKRYLDLQDIEVAKHQKGDTPHEDIARVSLRRKFRLAKAAVAGTLASTFALVLGLPPAVNYVSRLADKFDTASKPLPGDEDMRPVPQLNAPAGEKGMSMRDFLGRAADWGVIVIYAAYAIRKGYQAHQDKKELEFLEEEKQVYDWMRSKSSKAILPPPPSPPSPPAPKA